MIGKIYTTQAGFGYFMVMGRFPGFVIISPLFWIKGFTMLWRVPKDVFKQGYRPFDESVTSGYHPSVQAAFDLERFRRWRWIDVTGGRFGKDQSTGYVYGHGGGGE